MLPNEAVEKNLSCISCSRKTMDNFHWFNNDSYKIYRCEQCGLLYVYNLPTIRDIEVFYQHLHGRTCIDKKDDDRITKYIKSCDDEVNRYCVQIMEYFESIDFHPESFFEIGPGLNCVNRYFAQKGYETMAIELDESAIEFGREYWDMNIEKMSFDDYYQENPSKKFDLIFALDVIEHFRKPREFVSKVIDMLNPGGGIYVSTPNASGFEYVITPHRFLAKYKRTMNIFSDSSAWKKVKSLFGSWTDILPPYHLYSFNLENLKALFDSEKVDILFCKAIYARERLGPLCPLKAVGLKYAIEQTRMNITRSIVSKLLPGKGDRIILFARKR